jgi:hypothetical protein
MILTVVYPELYSNYVSFLMQVAVMIEYKFRRSSTLSSKAAIQSRWMNAVASVNSQRKTGKRGQVNGIALGQLLLAGQHALFSSHASS